MAVASSSAVLTDSLIIGVIVVDAVRNMLCLMSRPRAICAWRIWRALSRSTGTKRIDSDIMVAMSNEERPKLFSGKGRSNRSMPFVIMVERVVAVSSDAKSISRTNLVVMSVPIVRPSNVGRIIPI